MLQNFNYNGQIISKRADGTINLTQMCQANSKKLNDFLRLKSTQAYLQAMSDDTGKTASEIIEVIKGGNPSLQGTWGHPEIAIALAQWISPQFHRWCNAHIFLLMETGKTSLEINPIEEMKLKIELARLEAQKAENENKTLSLRHYIVTALPESTQQKVLGYSEVTKIEYRDRIINNNEVINDGSTINKTGIAYRYGFLTKNGKPDYPAVNKFLDRAKLPEDAIQLSVTFKENAEIKRDYLDYLDHKYETLPRQAWIGE